MKSIPMGRTFGSLLFVCLLTSSVFAKAWNEMVPGSTKKADVIARFGAPSKDVNRGGELSKGIIYQGKQAIDGTKQAQFFFDDSDVLLQIHVFPKATVKREQIIQTHGNGFEEKLTDSFKTYLQYRKDGLVVYFQEGTDAVASLIYQKPQ